ncbi:acetoacetate--CoA ligase [Nakamurella flavida]|uniref:Acetoacetate--CoA ligase n=1 Tax=Nakamurella flavida TaxID=363630 RepID=A0A938YNM3_9ACTN|nr:acetoacetate--CoA ligase [Nakamurella flavida]MBM9477866.1 acetoacetate--CoA ligase [Nakamurella flavida]MDP9779421.1 acetoacetyl-CoA synthetase [Nakamurella flavida]
MSRTDVVPEVLWTPRPERVEGAAITAFARLAGDRAGRDLTGYDDLWQWSVDDLGGFWTAVADFFAVHWHTAPTAALADARMPGAVWFPGGTLNYTEHALADRPGRGPDDLAVIAVDESGAEQMITLRRLRELVGAAQAGLRRYGVGPGDRVAALLPNALPALVGLLATAGLGAVWSNCSPDFGAGAVIDRFAQIEPTVLLTVDGYRYGGKDYPVADTVRRVQDALPGLAATVWLPVLSTTSDEAVRWTDLLAEPGPVIAEPIAFDAPLWVLWSSGTTGLPKPIVQSQGGILLEHLKAVGLQCDLGPADRFLWFSTTGWMMWNFLVGGLLTGATVVLYDGSPAHPDLDALWRLAERHRVDYLGASAAYVHSCRTAGLHPAERYDLTGLRTFGSTGSPLGPDGFRWLHDRVGGHVQIASISGGTDVCTAFVGAAPTVPVWSAEISCRALGARVEAFSPSGEALIDEVGELVLTAPLPSMPVGFWGDADGSRLREAYFAEYPGVWRHGDWIRLTSRGSCVIEGRSDSTLNRGGVRMGTAEFYRVVEAVDGVLDALVVDTSSGAHYGQLVLFLVPADGVDLDALTAAVRAAVRQELSPRHVPGAVVAVLVIPRTVNGKKCEVPVKRVQTGTPIDEAVSRDALADPDSLQALLDAARTAGVTA